MDISDDTHDSDSSSSSNQNMRVLVCPATGGQFEIEVTENETVEELQKKISRHLQTPRDRLKVLFKNKVLSTGTIMENNIRDGNKVTLLPAIESGFSSTVQGTQQSIIQAIESLSDVQIDDFLSGRSPLTLALRVGDHMMFVQLQLEQSVAQSSTAGLVPSASSAPGSTSSGAQSSRSHRHRQLYSQLSGFPPHCSITQSTAGINCTPPSTFPGRSQATTSALPTSASPSHPTTPQFISTPTADVVQKPVGANDLATVGGPTAGLLYKSATASNSAALKHSLPHPVTLEETSHIDKLVSACSSLGPPKAASSEVSSASLSCKKLERKASSSKSPDAHSLPANSCDRTAGPSFRSGTFPPSSQNAQLYRRISTTSGKITSGVGSLSNNGSSMSGTRVVRQMQRLRRLCGSHQQCVAYSSPELASEISSIVHAAKHHSGSESGSSSHHRRCSKSSTRERSRPLSVAAKPVKPPVSGACIDSFTTHGPGIFSGTFSGSLHPNIQDKEGRPKRDPQTILQILTDLLSATNQYQGQTGNIGMLPQLLRDHFAKQQAENPSTSTPSTTSVAPSTSSSDRELRPSRSQHSHKRHQPYHHHSHFHHHHHHHHHHLYPHQPQPHSRMTYSNTPPCYPFLTGTGPGIPPHYPTYPQMSPADQAAAAAAAAYHYARSSEGALALSAHQHRSGKCSHRRDESQKHGKSSRSHCSCGLSGSSRSRSSKQHALNINVSRLRQLQQENTNTRNKMRQLTEKLQQRRLRRQLRREACGPYKRAGAVSISASGAQDKLNELNGNGSNNDTVRSERTNVEVQIDDLSDYADDRKSEVAHESPETVTV